MKQREIVVDLVKAAFVLLIVKVMASSSVLMPWNSLVDNLCIIFAHNISLHGVIFSHCNDTATVCLKRKNVAKYPFFVAKLLADLKTTKIPAA